jgi:hypothetical protein
LRKKTAMEAKAMVLEEFNKPLEQANQALKVMANKEAVKAVIHPHE